MTPLLEYQWGDKCPRAVDGATLGCMTALRPTSCARMCIQM